MPCYPGFLEQGRLKLGQTILPRLNEKVDGGHRKSAGERQFFFFFGSLCFGMVSASGNWTEWLKAVLFPLGILLKC